eukprot:452899_1
MKTRDEVQLAQTITESTETTATATNSNDNNDDEIKQKKWYNFGHIMWWVTFIWAVYDFTTNYASVMSLKVLADVCDQFGCNMVSSSFNIQVDLYYGAFCVGFTVDMLIHIWEGYDMWRVFKNPLVAGNELDIKQTKRMMWSGWVAVILCDWATILIIMTLFFKSVQHFEKINWIFLKSLLVSNVSIVITGIRAVYDRIAYMELVQKDADKLSLNKKLQAVCNCKRNWKLEREGYQKTFCTPSCCHCCWVMFMICVGMCFGVIAFVATFHRQPFPFVDLNGNLDRGDFDGPNDNNCYNTRNFQGLMSSQGKEENGMNAVLNENAQYELILNSTCNGTKYNVDTLFFRCYTPKWSTTQNLDCSLTWKRPEEYNPWSAENDTDFVDGFDFTSTDIWDEFNVTDITDDLSVYNPCPLRIDCKFIIPYDFCGEFMFESCYDRHDLPWIGNVTLFVCYQLCIP